MTAWTPRKGQSFFGVICMRLNETTTQATGEGPGDVEPERALFETTPSPLLCER
jgi:hypothetical protein